MQENMKDKIERMLKVKEVLSFMATLAALAAPLVNNLKQKVLPVAAAATIGMSSLTACNSVETIKNKQTGEAIAVIDNTEENHTFILNVLRVVFVETPQAVSHLLPGTAQIISAAGGIYSEKRRWDAQEDWQSVIEENNNQYWNYQNNALKPQPIPAKGRRQVPQTVTGNPTTNANVQIIRNGNLVVRQYQ